MAAREAGAEVPHPHTGTNPPRRVCQLTVIDTEWEGGGYRWALTTSPELIGERCVSGTGLDLLE